MKIGWIGVGNMGKPMAKHIQEYASEFTVCDLNQEAAVDILENGGKWAETPSECAQDKDILFMSLPMPQDVEKVSTGKDGIIESVKPGKYIFRMIRDNNRNKEWDTGNYLKKIQPEEVYYSNFELEIRANWDFNETLNLNEVQMDSIQSN